MKRSLFLCTVVVFAGLFSLTAISAPVPITGTSQSVSLSDLVGTRTMLTVVLKDGDAKDSNLKLAEVRDDRLVFLSTTGEIVPYLLDSIASIEVQDGVVQQRRAPDLESQVLRAEHQRIVDRAWSRIKDIFQKSDDNQPLKMEAAMLLAMSGEENAHEYLRQLAGSNDLVLQLQAAGMLYLIGDVVPENLIRQGLESGKRDARIMAASLSGLAGYKDAVPTLRPLFMDRSVQYSAPAARALARLDDHTILDRLQAMLFELQQEKGEAAIFALTKLQDASVIEGLKFRLLEADGSNRLRIARVLFNLGDPTGIDELQHIFKTYPTLMPEVALMLAANGYWDAIQFLQTRLARREDPTESNLAFRARNAQALLASGDPSAMAVFQELLRSDKEAVTSLVFSLMTELGQPRLITLLQPSIENSNPAYALDACKAVISLALPSFRTRLLEYRIEFPEITH